MFSAPNWRINLILFFIFVFGAAITCRLVFLQVTRHDFYDALAKGQQKFLAYNFGDRGEIFLQDKEGVLYPLAVNKNWILAYASPNEIPADKKEETAKTVSEVLGLDKDFILETESDLVEEDLKILKCLAY